MGRLDDGMTPPMTCFMCGNKTSEGGYWVGAGETEEGIAIAICEGCALGHPQCFAAIIADAVAGREARTGKTVDVHRVLDAFQREFWRALALARAPSPCWEMDEGEGGSTDG